MLESIEQVPTAFGLTPLSVRTQPGDPSRPPLITIHGLFSNSKLFDSSLPHLRAANFPTVISFDLPGFGKSPPFLAVDPEAEETPSGVNANRTGEHKRLVGHRVKHYTATIKGLLDFHGVGEEKPASLVAHGEGCFLALHLIATYPDLVSSVVLISPVLPPTTDRGKHTFTLLQTLAKEKGPHALLVSLMNLTTTDTEQELKSKVGLMFGSSIAPSTEGFLGLCDVMTHTPLPSYDNARPLEPVIILGKQDSHAPPPDARTLAEDLHGNLAERARQDWHDLKQVGLAGAIERRKERMGKCIEVEGGHWILLEKPKEMAELVAKALKL